MILISFISALILMESREVFHSMVSQPFVVSLFLIFAGYDPEYVLISAVIIHLIYINFTPSGSSLFPEYPFGFFLVVSIYKSNQNNFIIFLLSLIFIIVISRITAYIIKYKRQLSERYRERFLLYRKFPNIGIAAIYSFVILFIYSFVLIFMLKYFFDAINLLEFADMKFTDFKNIAVFLCLPLALNYAYNNFKTKIR